MQSQHINNLITLSALLGRHTSHNAIDISIALVKLQKIATTLRKRYAVRNDYPQSYLASTATLEKRAVDPAGSVGAQLNIVDKPEKETFILCFANKEGAIEG